MNITLFIPSLVGCGAERVMVNLANYLCEKGHVVSILNYRVNDSSYRLDDRITRHFLYQREERTFFVKKVIQYFFTGLYSSLINMDRLFRLKRFILSNKTDCYLVMLERSTIDLLKLHKYIHCPVIVSERNYPKNYPQSIQDDLYSLADFADGFVFQTEAARVCYGDNVKSSVVIPNALNKGFLGLEPSGEKKDKVIVNAGRLEKQKNQELLIRAFAGLGLPDYTLEIYGEGPLKDHLQELINGLDIADRAFLKGYTDNIKGAIGNASLFVLSSDYEGIPNVLLEAMAMGIPCITTDFAGGGAHVLIDDEISGLIVGVGKKDELVSAMKRVLLDKCLAERLSKNGREKVGIFTPEEIYGKWEEYITSLL